MILIDMPMPKNCYRCPCSYFTEGAFSDVCELTGTKIEDEKIRLPNCPLREVTERQMDEYVAWLEKQIAWDNKKCIEGGQR